MAVAAARITAFLKSVADAGSDLLAKIAYGTPGSQVVYPEATPLNQAVTGAQDTGQVYPGVVIPGLLAQIGAEMDKAACVWAVIDTNGAGIAPTIVLGHPNVASVTKDESADSLRLDMDPWYTSANYYARMDMMNVIGVSYASTLNAAYYICEFVDALTGLALDINNKRVLAFSCGQV